MEIDNQVVDMEVDTGAACSLMSEVSFRQLWPSHKLSKAGLRLCTYSGEPIPVLGTLTVNVPSHFHPSHSQVPIQHKMILPDLLTQSEVSVVLYIEQEGR